MLFSIYGRMTIRLVQSETGWQAFHVSHDGKKRPVQDLHIAPDTPESALASVLDDIYHELATGPDDRIIRLDQNNNH